jgi:hypothetical protein
VRFGKYTQAELFEILKDKTSGFSTLVPLRILAKIAARVFDRGQGIVAAVNELIDMLQGAVMEGKAVLEIDEPPLEWEEKKIRSPGCHFGFHVE